ncbi:hypothetical protein A3J43_01205 [Candidatus Uhrbacteria bacterium RIFCSPHIGHO2_12_FULL_54_23]|uniref:DUF4012 domain-containing protein n=1 Tax=Candidatus Uhrbacteria bacterium RIFCSPHIGHO2_12_FULL_54_23 TaxID=1802397 RepID=A0A1F7UIE1_9BACT|nr:MAG: hypothetical protein A3J43_01205 [Candidatus Uhrbacteria bacterium RIFCSPHIGHO2_12_FULL_54_23]
MKPSIQKEIPIMSGGKGVLSPHVLDLRARIEKGEGGVEKVEKKEERGGKNKDAQSESSLRAPWLQGSAGEENWMKEQYHMPRVLERRPRSFQLWRGVILRGKKYRVKMNFYRAAVRQPEERVAEMAAGARGIAKKAGKVGNGFISLLFYCGVNCGRGVRWIGNVCGRFLRYSASRRLRKKHEDLKEEDAAGYLRESAWSEKDSPISEDELDDAPVILWRRAEVLTLIGLTLGLLIVVKGVSAWDAWGKTKGVVLGEAVEGVEALVAAHDAFARADMPAAIDRFLVAQERFASVSEEIEGNSLASVLGAFSPFKSGMGLVRLGEKSAQAAEHLLVGLKHLDDARAAFGSAPGGVSAALAEAEPAFLSLALAPLQDAVDELQKGEAAFREAQVAAAAVREEDIPEAYRPAVSSLKAVLPPAGRLLTQARVGAELLVSFFGAEKPRRILVLFQNDAELRPTGGFLGSYALIDIDKGRITSLSVPGGGLYDLKGSLTAQVDAPYPFHLFSPTWQVWNANWFFNVPTSARTLAWFLEKSQEPTVDGMIAITPVILEDLLALTGPAVLPEYQAVIDERNVRRILQDETEQNYDRAENKPKQIIADLVPLVIARIPQALSEYPAETIAAAARALDRHDILLWSSQPEEQARIEASGWGGAVAPRAGEDYLAVVHTNVGGGKTDRAFTETWTRELALTEDGDGVAKLVIARTHNGDPGNPYEKAHHVDYVRVFAPHGSTLIAAEGFEAPDPSLFKYDDTLDVYPELKETEAVVEEGWGVRASREHGLTSFGGWIMTKAGETSTVTLTYHVPDVVQEKSPFAFLRGGAQQAAHSYALTVQRQPGAPLAAFTDTILAPAEWGAAQDDQGAVSSEQKLIIDRDQTHTIVWH